MQFLAIPSERVWDVIETVGFGPTAKEKIVLGAVTNDAACIFAAEKRSQAKRGETYFVRKNTLGQTKGVA